MIVRSKIKVRLIWSIVGIFVLLTLLIGSLRALELSAILLIASKAYEWFKLDQFWQKESDHSRRSIEYVTERLNEGSQSDNLWIRYLATPDAREKCLTARMELVAAAKLVEARGGDLVQGWTYWATERIQGYVEALYDDLRGRQELGRVPTTVFEMLTQRVDLEFDVALNALTSLGATGADLRLGNVVDKCMAAICEIRAKKLTDFIEECLEGRSNVNSLWIEQIHKPGNEIIAQEYRKSLIEQASELRVNMLVSQHIKQWREWGAARALPDDEADDCRDVDRAAFEVLIAERALWLLGVDQPRIAISQMAYLRSQDKIARLRGEPPVQLKLPVFNSEELENELYWFMTCKLAEREKSKSLWVRALACDEMNKKTPPEPPQELVLSLKKRKSHHEFTDPEGWKLWGATRLHDYVWNIDRDILTSVALIKKAGYPAIGELMRSRAAFEVLVAEHALALLDVSNPHAEIESLMAEQVSS